MHLSRRKLLLLLGILLLVVSIPLTLSLTRQSQDTRSRASGGTNLSLIPQPGPGSFIEKVVGETVPIDVIVDPGSNSVSFVKLQIKFDPTKLQPVANNPFTVNTSVFPIVFEGPVVGSDTISISLSVGADPTKVVRTNTAKAGTVNLKAIDTTDVPTTVAFTNATQALSSGANDQTAEDVLSSVNPATVSISATGATISPSTDPSPSPSITFAPNETTLSFTALLHGIGAAGDSPNPTGNSLSNKNPKHQQKNIYVEIFDANAQLVTSKTGTITYDAQNGNFKGTVGLGTNFASGPYSVKVKSDQYLRRLVPGIQTITSGQNNAIPVVQMVAGDTNGDNTLDILDYSALLDCGYGDINPLLMTNSSSTFKQLVCQIHSPAANIDLDDNGIINSFDYNLFLRELSVQSGD